ncbi:vacuolar protein sorting-associated protein 13D [Lates japonicus]|uniref:Vacuolar protein sorting-associated protein 13D n=1 Tax=Lates japonicus TaxID=270547 RepID=A0AAD3QTX4_LATJO|nr:vacuolar protein sorting-associated protein 13D [Lates japonicus]
MRHSGQLDQAATWLLENAENMAGHPRARAYFLAPAATQLLCLGWSAQALQGVCVCEPGWEPPLSPGPASCPSSRLSAAFTSTPQDGDSAFKQRLDVNITSVLL